MIWLVSADRLPHEGEAGPITGAAGRQIESFITGIAAAAPNKDDTMDRRVWRSGSRRVRRSASRRVSIERDVEFEWGAS